MKRRQATTTAARGRPGGSPVRSSATVAGSNAHPRPAPRPLDDTIVLEYAGFGAAPYCGRLLADMGAEVIKVERPEGDESRDRGPFPDSPDPEGSALFLYVNLGKKSVTLDPATLTGFDLFQRLASQADVLIEDRHDESMESMGLGYEALRDRNPGLVYVSITPYGQFGPNARHRAADLNTFLSGGEGYSMPGSLSQTLFPGREPVRAGGYLSEHDAGSVAAVAAVSALLARNLNGHGQRVDLSKQEAAMAMTRETIMRWTGYGEVIDRYRGYHFGGIFQCLDGYMTIAPREDRHWQGLCEAMGREDLADDPRFRDFDGRRAHRDLLNGAIQAWSLQRHKHELYDRISRAGCPAGFFATAEDLARSPQLAYRGFLTELEHPRAGRLKYPSAPYHMSRTMPRPVRSAPLLGEHNEEVLCGRLGVMTDEMPALRRAGVI